VCRASAQGVSVPMKIQIKAGEMSGSELFSLVWQGLFFGFLVILVPLGIVVGIASIADGAENIWLLAWMPVAAVFNAFTSAILAGGLVLLGHKVRPKKFRKSDEA